MIGSKVETLRGTDTAYSQGTDDCTVRHPKTVQLHSLPVPLQQPQLCGANQVMAGSSSYANIRDIRHDRSLLTLHETIKSPRHHDTPHKFLPRSSARDCPPLRQEGGNPNASTPWPFDAVPRHFPVRLVLLGGLSSAFLLPPSGESVTR